MAQFLCHFWLNAFFFIRSCSNYWTYLYWTRHFRGIWLACIVYTGFLTYYVSIIHCVQYANWTQYIGHPVEDAEVSVWSLAWTQLWHRSLSSCIRLQPLRLESSTQLLGTLSLFDTHHFICILSLSHTYTHSHTNIHNHSHTNTCIRKCKYLPGII